jgi:redox-sensing transcriptional repressor
MKVVKIPEKTVTRLSIYLRSIEELETQGVTSVSSRQLAGRLGLNSAQVRKDLAYFGQFGVRGLGYYLADLKHNLERILGLKQDWEVALVGAGNLGSALIAYKGFQARGFRIGLAFDSNPAKIGRQIDGVTVQDAAKMAPTLRRKKVKIAVMAVPADAGQAVADQLVDAGVTAILNFAPNQLSVPESVKVQNVDLSVLLKTLSYHTVRTDRDSSRRSDASRESQLK